MKAAQKFQFVVISLFAVTIFTPAVSINCNTNEYRSSDDSDYPVVQVYDAKDDVANYDNNGTVLLGVPSSETETIGWIGLECKHSKPVRWVYDLNFIQAGVGDSYSLTTRSINTDDFYNTTNYEFNADIELKIHRPKLDFVMFCVTFENVCERTVARAYYDKIRKRYMLKLLQKSEENITLVTDLERATVERQNWLQKRSNNESCTVTFSMADYGDSFSYFFHPDEGNDSPRTVPDRQNLENVYLFHEKLNPACFTHNCSVSKSCYPFPKPDEVKYWPIVFFTPRKNMSRVVHAYHTIVTRYNNGSTGPGKLKLGWEISDNQDFVLMKLHPSRSTNKFYIGEDLAINCYASGYLFSAGTQILVSYPTKDVSFLNVTEEPEVESFGRLAKATMSLQRHGIGQPYNMTAHCFSPIWNSATEWVNVSKTVEVHVPSLHVNGTKKLITLQTDSDSYNVSFSCIASGLPAPELTVLAPGNNSRIDVHKTALDDNTTRADITITRVDGSHVGIFNCVATNAYGVEFFEFEIKLKSSKAEKWNFLVIVLCSIFVPIITIFLAIVIILAVKFRMEKEEFRRLTEEAIQDFLEGENPSQVVGGADSPKGVYYENDNVKTLPYNDRYEVPHKNWNFGDTLLGTGNFGIVIKGTVEVGSRKSIIAIKTIKSPDDIVDFKTTLLELKIMAHIGHHHHIVKLVAASTDEIQKRKVLIGVEFCANGSLLSYMQKRKRLFTNNVHDGCIHFSNENNAEMVDGVYDNLITSDISTLDLYKWSFQIACGMKFLESKNVLHADLAARNILLTDDLVVKISDFGLSRDLFENSEYTKKTQVALPWKWMSIESLKYLKFSLKSDVWSYGVTLYEVFTLGDDPYAGQAWSEEFVALLENGMRLERPPFCTDNVYNRVMMQCWAKEPNERITFADAMSFFEKAIGLLTSSVRNDDDECREFC